MPKFKVIRQIECPCCKGKGKVEHPDGDVEFCNFCGRRGYWESEVTLEEAMREVGVAAAQPATTEQAGDAAQTLRMAYYNLHNASGDVSCAWALVACAEQLAVLNKRIGGVADDVAYYVGNMV